MFSTVYYHSEIGTLALVAQDDVLLSCHFLEIEAQASGTSHHPILNTALAQIDAYFKGHLQQFSLPLAPSGSAFFQQVWQQLLTIPYAKTVVYREIAVAIGRPKAARAVGLANHHNPIGIIIPCHRVIGSNGKLTGYEGGLWRKEWLLAHEARYA